MVAMEAVAASVPWHILAGGGLATLAGILLVRSRTIEGLFSSLGSAAPSRRERVAVPAMLIFAGAGLLFTFFAEIPALAGHQRPFWVVASTLVLFPLSGLCLAAVAVWVAALRRFT